MFKIMVYSIKTAELNGIKFEDYNKIWVDLEISQYVEEENATVFKDATEANKYLMPWETIVKVS